MSRTLEPALYNPRIVTLPSGRTVLEEISWLKNWGDDDELPYVSLTNDSAARVFLALGLKVPEEGTVIDPVEMLEFVTSFLRKSDAVAAEFSCEVADESQRLGEFMSGCNCINLDNTSGEKLIQQIARVGALCEWAVEQHGNDARLGVS